MFLYVDLISQALINEVVLSFEEGQRCLLVELMDDDIVEGLGSIVLQLSPGTDASASTSRISVNPSVTRISVMDNDSKRFLSGSLYYTLHLCTHGSTSCGHTNSSKRTT